MKNINRDNCLGDMTFHDPIIKYSYNLILNKTDYNCKRK